MKFTINKNEVAKKLTGIIDVVQKSTVPILANFAITAEDGGVIFAASDMEIGVNVSFDCEVSKTGETTASAAKILEFIRKAPQNEVEFEIKGDKLAISSGRSRVSLATLPIADFPALKPSKSGVIFSMSATSFKNLLDTTDYAAHNDPARHYLNGVYFHFQDGDVKFVATDGHRLSFAQSSGQSGATFDGGIIPAKTVSIIKKIFDGSGELTINVSPNIIDVQGAGIALSSKLVDGQYPDYQRIVPQDLPLKLEVVNKEFLDAIDRMGVANDEKTNAVMFYVSKDNVRVETKNPEAEASDVVFCDFSSDDTFTFSANAEYVIDALKKTSGDKVTLHLSKNSPVFKITGDNENEYAIVSGMRL